MLGQSAGSYWELAVEDFCCSIAMMVPAECCGRARIKASGFQVHEKWKQGNFLKLMKSIPVIFLDRDGVINVLAKPHEYIMTWPDFVILPGVYEALRILRGESTEYSS